MGHDGRLRGVGGEAVEAEHGGVVQRVGAAQVGRHGRGVVEVGQRAVRILGAGVKDGLGRGFDLRPVSVRGRGPGEIVVDNRVGLEIIAFQTSTNNAHPSIM